MVKDTLFRQAWWVSLAVVLAGFQTVFAIGIGLDSEATGAERVVFFSVWGAGAALAVFGIQQRLRHRRRGYALIALGVVPAHVAGHCGGSAGDLVVDSGCRDHVGCGLRRSD